MGADHAFYNERARVLLPFRSIVRAHLVEIAASLTSRIGSASSASRLPGTFDSPIIASDEERVAMFVEAADNMRGREGLKP